MNVMSNKKINITNEIISMTSMLMLARYAKLNRVTVNIGYNTPIADVTRRCHVTSDIVRTDWKAQLNWKRMRNPLKPLN